MIVTVPIAFLTIARPCARSKLAEQRSQRYVGESLEAGSRRTLLPEFSGSRVRLQRGMRDSGRWNRSAALYLSFLPSRIQIQVIWGECHFSI